MSSKHYTDDDIGKLIDRYESDSRQLDSKSFYDRVGSFFEILPGRLFVLLFVGFVGIIVALLPVVLLGLVFGLIESVLPGNPSIASSVFEAVLRHDHFHFFVFAFAGIFAGQSLRGNDPITGLDMSTKAQRKDALTARIEDLKALRRGDNTTNAKSARYPLMEWLGHVAVGLLIIAVLVIVLGGGMGARDWRGRGDVNLYPFAGSSKNYRLEAEIIVRKHWFWRKDYTIESVDWPNSGKSTFYDCTINASSRECIDDEGRTWIIAVNELSIESLEDSPQ